MLPTIIIQGTTPTHTFTLPFDVKLVKSARFVYAQNGQVEVAKDMKDITVTSDAVATTKASNSDVMSAIKKGEAVFSKGSIIFYGLKGAEFNGAYGNVALWDATDNATCTIYYTAEYTP